MSSAFSWVDEKKTQIDYELSFTKYFYDMIIFIGYRISSKKATAFRRWATSTLKQHLIDGFTMNQKRLEHLNKTIEILSRSGDKLVSGIAEVLNFIRACKKKLLTCFT